MKKRKPPFLGINFLLIFAIILTDLLVIYGQSTTNNSRPKTTNNNRIKVLRNITSTEADLLSCLLYTSDAADE